MKWTVSLLSVVRNLSTGKSISLRFVDWTRLQADASVSSFSLFKQTSEEDKPCQRVTDIKKKRHHSGLERVPPSHFNSEGGLKCCHKHQKHLKHWTTEHSNFIPIQWSTRDDRLMKFETISDIHSDSFCSRSCECHHRNIFIQYATNSC